jgi:hypothetical protein
MSYSDKAMAAAYLQPRVQLHLSRPPLAPQHPATHQPTTPAAIAHSAKNKPTFQPQGLFVSTWSNVLYTHCQAIAADEAIDWHHAPGTKGAASPLPPPCGPASSQDRPAGSSTVNAPVKLGQTWRQTGSNHLAIWSVGHVHGQVHGRVHRSLL